MGYLYLFEAHIIVSDITLPQSIIERGESAENITQRSIIGIRQAAIDRLNKVTDNNNDFRIDPITGTAECLDMKFSMPKFVDSEMKMIEEAFARSGIPDIEVSPLKFSFSKIIIFFKKYFNLPFLDVYPTLLTDKNGYQLIIYASAPNDQKVTIK